MEAGAHVYCETPIAHTLDEARDIASAAERLGRKVQVGLQRRSHPAYRASIAEFGHELGFYGDILQASAHAHRVEKWRDPAQAQEVASEVLDRHGYGSIHQLLNWRWYRRYGVGPFSAWGIHEIDIFNWAFGGEPEAIVASLGNDVIPGVEHADNGMALFTYDIGARTRRALYTMNATSSHLGTFEVVSGPKGAVRLCLEAEWVAWPGIEASVERAELASLIQKGALAGIEVPVASMEYFVARNSLGGALIVDSTPTIVYPRDGAAIVLDNLAVVAPQGFSSHYFHLVNFFDAVAYDAPLTCPPAVGIAALRAALSARDAHMIV
jgi:predicted dehydrogenase